MGNLVLFWNVFVVVIMPIITVSARPNIIDDSLGHLQDSLANIQKNVAGQLTGLGQGTIGNFPLIPQLHGQIQFGQGLLGGLNFNNHKPQHNNQAPQNQRFPTDYGSGNDPNFNQFQPPSGYGQASASATASASSSNYAGNPNHHHNNQPNGNPYSPNNPNSNSHFGHNHNYNQNNGNRPHFNRYPNQDTNYAGSDHNNQFIQNAPNTNMIPNQNLPEHSGNSGHTNTDQYIDNNVKPVIENIDDVAPPNGPQKPIAFQNNRQDNLENITTVMDTKTEKEKEKITSVKEDGDEEQMYSIDIRNGDGGDTKSWA